MSTAGAHNFAHGTYGDISGVVFYGPAVKGFWEDSFPVSDRFIEPLFRAIVNRAELVERAKVPGLVAEWTELTGWRDAAGMVELPAVDVSELIGALAAISKADLAPHAAEWAVTPDECLRCAAAIAGFLGDRVRRGLQIYIERD
jgi:hypothetical protein